MTKRYSIGRYIVWPALVAAAILAFPSTPALAVAGVKPIYEVGAEFAQPRAVFSLAEFFETIQRNALKRQLMQGRVGGRIFGTTPRPRVEQNHQPNYQPQYRYHHNF